MYNLIESNLSIFKNLNFKYKSLQLFKESNIDCKKFYIEPILSGDISDIFDFNHDFLKLYFKHKDSIIGDKVPLLPFNFNGVNFLYDLFSDSDEFIFKFCSSLGFSLNFSCCFVENNRISLQEKLRPKFPNFGMDCDDDLFEVSDYVTFNQVVLTHPILDALCSRKDTSLEDLSSYLDFYSNELSYVFYNPASPSCYSSKASISSLEDLELIEEDSFDFSRHKYGIILNSIETDGWYEGFNFHYCLDIFLEFYKLLLKNSSPVIF